MRQDQQIYKVSQLTDEMRRLMETSYPEIWIEGELSSLSRPASGHLYFSLKDETAQLRCAMFKGRASISRYQPKAGDLVRVRAKISVYTARGDLQCIVQHIEEAGEGLLQRRFEELKQKLSTQGLFDQEHKRALPKLPKHIGIVTSPSGAAVRDVVTTLKRRCANIPVTIYPAVVQGDSAAPSIVAAINDAVAHQRADLIILCRGGGSLEDLWCFNHEDVAQSIYNCPIPIVSGVGHEVDVTIADFVADLRAPTPTAAAELVSPDMQQFEQQLRAMGMRLPRWFERALQHKAQAVDMLGKQLSHPRQALDRQSSKLQTIGRQLGREIQLRLEFKENRLQQQVSRLANQNPGIKLAHAAERLAAQHQRLMQTQTRNHATRHSQVKALAAQLHAVSPLATMERGFSIARNQQGEIIRSSDQADINSELNLDLARGKLHCKVVAKAERDLQS